MVKKVTFYYHNMCSGCDELKPIIKGIAKSNGWKFKTVNVERCKSKICDGLEYVPAVFIDDKQLDIDELESLLEKEL